MTILAGSDAGAGFMGQVQVGRLLGTLDVHGSAAEDRAPPTAIIVDQDVLGTIRVHNPFHRGLAVYGAVTSSGKIDLQDSLVGSAEVQQGMHGTLSCANVGQFAQLDVWGPVDGVIDLGSITGHVNFWNGMGGTLTGNAVSGQLVVAGAAGPQGLTGTATFGGNVSQGGLIDISGVAGLAGSLSVAGVLGDIHVTHDVSGALQAGGSVSSSGAIQIDGAVTAQGHVSTGALDGVVILATLNGDVHVHGGLSGRLEVLNDVDKSDSGPAITVDQDVTGQIRIYGSLRDDANEAHEIRVDGAMPSPGAIAVDWDGWQESDIWWQGAAISVGPMEYHGNTPGARVWYTSRIHGDVDNTRNDRVNPYYPDFTDINPFVLAMSDKVQFCLTYPGLADTDGTVYTGGGILYKADCNCDGSVNFGDVNPFVALVGGTCDPACPDCQPPPGGDSPMGGDEPLTPEELAAQLAASILPELYDNLLFVVAGAIEAAPDEETQAYWQAVYAALTQ